MKKIKVINHMPRNENNEDKDIKHRILSRYYNFAVETGRRIGRIK
jgi:hypothetical protein